MMVITQSQCFLIAVVITAAIGARRGWGREVITTAILLGTVLFLTNGGDKFISNGLGTLLAAIPHSLGGASQRNTISGNVADPPLCSPLTTQIISTAAFTGLTWLGYQVGYKHGTAPKSYNHRIAGIIPGAVNGTAIAYYVSHSVLNGQGLTLYSPTNTVTSAELPVVFGLGFLGLLLVLFIAAQANKK